MLPITIMSIHNLNVLKTLNSYSKIFWKKYHFIEYKFPNLIQIIQLIEHVRSEPLLGTRFYLQKTLNILFLLERKGSDGITECFAGPVKKMVPNIEA